MTSMHAGPDAGDPYEFATSRALAGGKALVARHLAVGVLSLAGAVFLIRSIGAEAWAAYSVAYFVLVFIDQAFGANLLGGLVRQPAAPTKSDVEASAALMQVFGLGAAALLIVTALPAGELYGDRRLTFFLLAVAVCAYVYAVRSTSVALLERHLNYGWIAIAEVVDQLTFYLVAVPLVLLEQPMLGVMLALAIRGLPPAIILRHRLSTPLRGRLLPAETRRLLGFAKPTLGTAMLVLLNGLVPVVVLGGDHATELAFIMATVTILGYAATVQVVIQRVGFPTLAVLQIDPERFRSAVAGTIGGSNFLMVSVLVPLAGLSPLWLPVLFGADWNRAGYVMVAFGVGFLFNGLVTVITSALNSLGRPRDVFLLQSFMTGTYAALAFGLSRYSVLLGAAIGYAAARAGGAGLAIALLKRQGYAVVWASEAMIVATASALMTVIAIVAEKQAPVALVLAVSAAAVWFSVRREFVELVWRMLMVDRARPSAKREV